MAFNLPAYKHVVEAAERLYDHAYLTPIMRHDLLDKISGLKIFLKNETVQKTGSFKYRGAYSRLSVLSSEEKQRGIVAFSSGNHAQGVALAAKELGISAIIVMPKSAPEKKKKGTLAHGANIVEYDIATESREDIAARISQRDNRIIVPSYDDPYIIAGQGTIGKEIGELLNSLDITPDALITPIGGGGLCAGISLAMGALCPTTKIYGAEPMHYDDTYRSLAAGKRVANINPPNTLCDALMTPTPGNLTFAINQKSLSGVFHVTDTECLITMALLKQCLDITVEPGGSVALTAVLNGRSGLAKGSIVVIILSGGNVDESVVALSEQTRTL
ncbi:MAG: pyridoxal-5'-phosphate-dependent protein [Robiginitomaculum sp.]|nr:MAG: pyridoxal-5'-phosphate-dependent protein [Robiginitomaculum sp.]